MHACSSYARQKVKSQQWAHLQPTRTIWPRVEITFLFRATSVQRYQTNMAKKAQKQVWTFCQDDRVACSVGPYLAPMTYLAVWPPSMFTTVRGAYQTR
ncbi:hypothetical protein M0657_004190 [Pyricularia oryzae]|nr:hypothetical protein M0657_004190 [Pyricularia oryzae]KAI7925630.1 hypothetical protein M9X92_003191 [Pyricularia oryzae]